MQMLISYPADTCQCGKGLWLGPGLLNSKLYLSSVDSIDVFSKIRQVEAKWSDGRHCVDAVNKNDLFDNMSHFIPLLVPRCCRLNPLLGPKEVTSQSGFCHCTCGMNSCPPRKEKEITKDVR